LFRGIYHIGQLVVFLSPRLALEGSLASVRVSRLQIALLLVAFVVAKAAERSVSTSRQFIVYGGDVRLRGALCDLGEQTKKNLLTLLGERDEWRIPIVINAELPQANFPEAPSAHLQLARSEAGLKLQLDLTIGTDVQAVNIERELLRGLLVEIVYRDAPMQPGTEYVQPPPWLVEGMLARERDREAAAQTLQPFVDAGSAIPLEAFLQQRPDTLDPASLQLYRAYSAALLDLILRGNDAHRLGQFIRDLRHGSVDPAADLVAHFPQLNGMSGAADAWKQQLARVSGSARYRLVGVAETERVLDNMLHIKIGETTYGIEEFARILRARGSQAALHQLSEQLLLFEPRSNPVYREIVIEYQEIVALLARGSSKRVAERLTRAKEWRQQLATRMSRIDDYLNWFEATQQTTSSGLFTDYLKAADANDQPARHRRDAMSVYLDAIETQLE
jgi:hypothetical protein